jgi:hypothetical protein
MRNWNKVLEYLGLGVASFMCAQFRLNASGFGVDLSGVMCNLLVGLACLNLCNALADLVDEVVAFTCIRTNLPPPPPTESFS